MDYKIPPFYRILIIDDKIAGEEKYRNPFLNLFSSLIYHDAPIQNIHTEVVLVADPVEGLKRWQDEIFDLTLIDSDFSSQLKNETDPKKLEDIFLASNHQGFNILSLMDNMVSEESSNYSHRKGMCQFYLWSGLHDGVERSVNIIDSLFKQFSLTEKQENYFISKLPYWKNNKDETGLKRISTIIGEGLDKSISGNFDSWQQKVERFLFAVQENYCQCADSLLGGCMIFDRDNAFPFARELTSVPEQDKAIRILPGRVPLKLLPCPEKAPPFLPLVSQRELGLKTTGFIQAVQKDGKAKPLPAATRLSARHNLLFSTTRPIYRATKGPLASQDTPCRILGYPFKNHYLAAATPLTGISVIGEQQAIDSLEDKVLALLDGPAGGVILKTTYLDKLDQWKGVHWPAIQVQSHMRSRCLKPKDDPVLWNTGRTALEMLSPQSLNKMLHQLKPSLGGQTHKVIVSLGSKFFQKESEELFINEFWEKKYSARQKEIWGCLFDDVFNRLDEKDFPLIEINVRHFLREIVEFYLVGDEYLNPVDLAKGVKLQTDGFWNDFKIWLTTVHEVAVKFNKKLIMKLPYRSDTLAFIQSILSLRETHKNNSSGCPEAGVRALTLVNALKNPVPTGPATELQPYSRQWYAHPYAWQDAGDKMFKYQMSGAYLSSYRNQILAGLMQENAWERLAAADLEILISGGVTDKDVCKYFNEWKEHINCSRSDGKQVISGIQIGTHGLLHTDMTPERSWGITK